ncbi:MAG: ABC transporter substrate-binding protein [Synergistaceae bacterium]|jgi:peptide/nickel transport system substrate-binding protein|nr:ABC transporter substrate-binding protein [Synergistaceae bacterium]
MQKWFRWVLVAILVPAFFLSAPQGAEAARDSLVIATENEPPSLTTVEHDSLASVFMNLLTYNGLIRITQDTLEPVPDLAASYTVSGTEWTFKLKEGVLFHDGQALTASDVVASLLWAKTFPSSVNYTGKIAKVEELDPLTVKITTNGLYAGLLYDLGYHFNFIVPKKLIDSKNNFNTNPIGTGPYKFVKWSRGDSLEFVKNDKYFDKKLMPSIDKVIWRFIPEGTSRTIALEAGEVDFIYEVETTDIPRLKDNPDVKVTEVTSVVNWFLSLNKDVKPYDDVNFRQALSAGIDREAIVAAALNGFGTPNSAAVPKGFKGFTDKNSVGYDPEKAKAHLKDWGGDPSKVTVPIICSNETKVRVATVIQENLSKLGIKVDIVTMDLASYLDKTGKGDYESAIVSWSPSNIVTYIQRYHSRRRASNPGSLNDKEIDARVEKIESTLDEAERLALVESTVELLNGLSPQPSLYQDIIFRAYNKDLEGVVPSATGYINFNEVRWAK